MWDAVRRGVSVSCLSGDTVKGDKMTNPELVKALQGINAILPWHQGEHMTSASWAALIQLRNLVPVIIEKLLRR